jgi:cob(I)alamin adenosyltransferase
MKIYTKSGDRGKTSLLGGQRVSKDVLRIEAYGTVDELNSALGVARASKPAAELDRILGSVQRDLFILGADLAAPAGKRRSLKQVLTEEHVVRLEQTIDSLDVQLAPLKNFIIPGGSPIAAQLHLARTVCRRAERLVVRLAKKEKVGKMNMKYLNRLSDALFVVARYANRVEGISDVPWFPLDKP